MLSIIAITNAIESPSPIGHQKCAERREQNCECESNDMLRFDKAIAIELRCTLCGSQMKIHKEMNVFPRGGKAIAVH